MAGPGLSLLVFPRERSLLAAGLLAGSRALAAVRRRRNQAGSATFLDVRDNGVGMDRAIEMESSQTPGVPPIFDAERPEVELK